MNTFCLFWSHDQPFCLWSLLTFILSLVRFSTLTSSECLHKQERLPNTNSVPLQSFLWLEVPHSLPSRVPRSSLSFSITCFCRRRLSLCRRQRYPSSDVFPPVLPMLHPSSKVRFPLTELFPSENAFKGDWLPECGELTTKHGQNN